MRFSVASGTDNSLLQLIANDTEPYGIGGLLWVNIQNLINAAPHASTSRGSYTVPANRIARLDYFELDLFRFAVAGPAGLAQITLALTPSGAGQTIVSRAFISIVNTVGDRHTISSSPKIILEAGDELEIFTTDASAGGSVSYNFSINCSELDA